MDVDPRKVIMNFAEAARNNILAGFGVAPTKEHLSVSQMEARLAENFQKGLIDEDLFNKATEELELLKGGEGSKGGQITGHTTSGKPIYAHHDDYVKKQSGKNLFHYKPGQKSHGIQNFSFQENVPGEGEKHGYRMTTGAKGKEKSKTVSREELHDHIHAYQKKIVHVDNAGYNRDNGSGYNKD